MSSMKSSTFQKFEVFRAGFLALVVFGTFFSAATANEIESVLRATPYFKDGEHYGFRLYPKTDSDLKAFERLGFEPGDLLVEVDGQKLSNPPAPTELFSRLERGEPVLVTVSRNDEFVEFSLIHNVSASTVYPDEDTRSAYSDRPLNLPMMTGNDMCPVSTGNNSIVAPDHGYVFGAGGYFFGTGPVYLALSWKPSDRAEAYFRLDERTLTHEGYRLKTPWVMHPDYNGEALIRGAQIGEKSTEVLFSENTQAVGITANMILHSAEVGTLVSAEQRNAVEAVWGFWPSHIILANAGCYAIQIDTADGTDIVVFEAIAQK